MTAILVTTRALIGAIPTRLYRLDARAGLPADVPDALLRFLAQCRCAQDHFLYVVAIGRNSSGAAVPVSGGHIVRASDGQASRQRRPRRTDRADYHPPRSRDLWPWVVVSRAGICDRISVGAVDRPSPRGHP